jgi:hypothetical protein
MPRFGRYSADPGAVADVIAACCPGGAVLVDDFGLLSEFRLISMKIFH